MIDQSPKADTTVKVGSKITLYVSLGAATEEQTMPDLIGKNVAIAKSQLDAMGFSQVQIEHVNDDEVPRGRNIKQERF